MRIAMVSEHASPLAALGGVDAGGQNVHVAALSISMATLGHDVTVYTRRDDPGLDEEVPIGPGVRVVHVPAGPPEAIAKDDLLPYMPEFGLWMAESFAAKHPSDRPELLHAHFWMSGLAALQAAEPTGTPVVQTFHALGSVKRRHQKQRDTSPSGRIEAEAMLARSVAQVVATCSDEVAELHRLGVRPGQVQVVPCGVDVSLFRPQGVMHTAPPYRLLVVGRLVERKGVDTVIRALTALPDAELVIAGGAAEGRDADGAFDGSDDADVAARLTDPEARRLLALADELGVRGRVRLLGSVPHEQLPRLMCSADVVVATPWYEPFGIVPIEAAACGRPLVGSAVGGLLDTVQDGVTGVLVPPRDPDALAAALRALLDDPHRRIAMGQAARRRAVARYSWRSVARATESVYAALTRAQIPSEVTAV